MRLLNTVRIIIDLTLVNMPNTHLNRALRIMHHVNHSSHEITCINENTARLQRAKRNDGPFCQKCTTLPVTSNSEIITRPSGHVRPGTMCTVAKAIYLSAESETKPRLTALFNRFAPNQ